MRIILHFAFLLIHHFYCPAELEGGFTLYALLLDKPWSQVSSLLPPLYVPSFSCRA